MQAMTALESGLATLISQIWNGQNCHPQYSENLWCSLVPRLSWDTNMYCLHNFNVHVPERGSLRTRLGLMHILKLDIIWLVLLYIIYRGRACDIIIRQLLCISVMHHHLERQWIGNYTARPILWTCFKIRTMRQHSIMQRASHDS